jgi:hypothetical protein
VKILWLKTELLHPVDKGGKIRSYNMLKELKRNCHVTYLTLDDGTAATDAPELASEYCHELVTIPHPRREKFTTGFYVDLISLHRCLTRSRSTNRPGCDARLQSE